MITEHVQKRRDVQGVRRHEDVAYPVPASHRSNVIDRVYSRRECSAWRLWLWQGPGEFTRANQQGVDGMSR